MIVASQRNLLPSAARTAETFSASQSATGELGGLLIHRVTVASGTGGLQLIVQAESPAGSGNWVDMLRGQNPIVDAMDVLTPMMWGAAWALELKAAQILPIGLGDVWRVRVTHGDATSYTYSVEFLPFAEPFLDYDTGAGVLRVPISGIALPASGGPVAGGTTSNPIVVSGPAAKARTNRSGTITLGGTAQQLAAADTNRKFMQITNPGTAELWVNVGGTAAANTNGSEQIRPGGYWWMDPVQCASDAISIVGAMTGQHFTAWEIL